MKSAVKITGFTLFLIWMAGSAVTYVYDAWQIKSTCVENEGWLKGIFWCSDNPSNKIELGIKSTTSMVKAMSWPFRLANDDEDNKSDINKDATKNKEDVSVENNYASMPVEDSIRDGAKKMCMDAQLVAVTTYGLLKDGKTKEEARSDMSSILKKYQDNMPDDNLTSQMRLNVAKESMRIVIEEEGSIESRLEMTLISCRDLWNAILPTLKLPTGKY